MKLLYKFSLVEDFSSSMYSLSAKLLNFFVQSLKMILSTLKSVSSDTKVNLSQKFSLLVLEKAYRNGCTQMGYVTIQNPFIVYSSISDTLLFTDILGQFAGIPINARALVESDNNRTESIGYFRVAMTLGVQELFQKKACFQLEPRN